MLKFADLGQQQLKNIPERVHAYAASLDQQGTSKRRPRRSRKWLRWTAAALAIGVAYFIYLTFPPADLEECRGQDSDRAIAACTKIISEGRIGYYAALAYLYRGHSYNAKGDYDRAMADLNEAIRLDPSLAVTYLNRGNAYSYKGEHDRAIADYSEAIRLDPKLAMAYNNRGANYLRKGEYERALADFSESIRLDPKSALAYANRGTSYNQKGEYDRAIIDLNEAIRLDPTFAAGYSNRGNAYSDKREYDRAISDYSEAIRLDPKDFTYYANRALTYLKMDKPAQGLPDADQALQLSPNNQTVLNTRGHLLFALGRKEEASKDLAGSKDPSVPASKAAPDGAGLDCRRYIPSAGISVAVSCTD